VLLLDDCSVPPALFSSAIMMGLLRCRFYGSPAIGLLCGVT
jgi:hypothetical protein